jgi:hypothetical protein
MDVVAIEGAVTPPRELWHATWDGAGPAFLIGDVHGCADELEELLKCNTEGKSATSSKLMLMH